MTSASFISLTEDSVWQRNPWRRLASDFCDFYMNWANLDEKLAWSKVSVAWPFIKVKLKRLDTANILVHALGVGIGVCGLCTLFGFVRKVLFMWSKNLWLLKSLIFIFDLGGKKKKVLCCSTEKHLSSWYETSNLGILQRYWGLLFDSSW